MMKELRNVIYRYGIKPLSANADDRRREVVFNVLISIVSIAAAVAMCSSAYNHIVYVNHQGSSELPLTIAFFALSIGLWGLSRRRHYQLAAYGLLLIIWLVSLQLMLGWSFALPVAQLVNVLVIIIAATILRSRAGLIVGLCIAIGTAILGYIQVHGYQHPDIAWLTQPLLFSDAVGLVMVLMIITGISWLANKQIDSSLSRARKSEKALVKERDQLEVTVAKRTHQLEEAQYQKLVEVERLAEFGRISASLVHDLADPLTAVSLSLEQVGSDQQSKLLDQAIEGLRHLEDYIDNARNHLRGQSRSQAFDITEVAKAVVKLLKTQARSKGVTLVTELNGPHIAKGDPVILQRVLTNLVRNGIDACHEMPKTNSFVKLGIVTSDTDFNILVEDNGRGITDNDLPQVFNKFYSTKVHSGRDVGLGLFAAKHAIEEDFKGSLVVASKPNIGTTFTIQIPRKHDQSRERNS